MDRFQGVRGGRRKFYFFSFCTAPRQVVVSTKPPVLRETQAVHEGIIRLGRDAIICLDLTMALGRVEIFLPFPSLGTHLFAAVTCPETSSIAFSCLMQVETHTRRMTGWTGFPFFLRLWPLISSWVRTLAVPLHVGLKTGPFCRIISYQVKGALLPY